MQAHSTEYDAYPPTRYAHAVATLIAADDAENRTFTPDVSRVELNQKMTAANAEWQKNLTALWGNNGAGIEQLWAECNDAQAPLDGSICVFPDDLSGIPAGVWSEFLTSDPALGDGEFRMFGIHLGGVYEFDTVTIVFDEAAGIYPIEFGIFAADADDSEKSTYMHITNNTDVICKITFPKTVKSQYIHFNCTRLNVSNAHPRFAYLCIGQLVKFTPDQIVSLKTTPEISLSAESAPASELVLEVVNEDQQYDVIHPTGIWAQIAEGNTIAARIGVGPERTAMENFNAGVYIVDAIEASEDQTTVTITAHDPFYSRMDDAFHKQTAERVTLEAAVNWILDSCDMGYLTIEYVPDSLRKKMLTLRGDFSASCREALRMVCQAVGAIPRFSESGTLVIGDISQSEPAETIAGDCLHNYPKIARDTRISQVIGTFYHVGATKTTEETKLYEGNVQNGENWIAFTNSAYTAARGARTDIPHANLEKLEFYLRGARIVLKNLQNDLKATVSSDYDCKIYESEHSYTNTRAGEKRHSHSVSNACVYPTYENYQPFLEWFYSKMQYSQLAYQFTDRGNPARQVGDTVAVTLRNGDTATAIVEKMQIVYDGTLSCDTTAAGVAG